MSSLCHAISATLLKRVLTVSFFPALFSPKKFLELVGFLPGGIHKRGHLDLKFLAGKLLITNSINLLDIDLVMFSILRLYLEHFCLWAMGRSHSAA